VPPTSNGKDYVECIVRTESSLRSSVQSVHNFNCKYCTITGTWTQPPPVLAAPLTVQRGHYSMLTYGRQVGGADDHTSVIPPLV